MVGLKLKEENGGSCYHPKTLNYEGVYYNWYGVGSETATIFWPCRKNGKNTYTEKGIRIIM